MLALFVGCVAGGFERRPQSSPDLDNSAGSLAIEHITVIDGTGMQPQPDMSVAVENGRITYVGSTARQRPFAVSRTIDGRNRRVSRATLQLLLAFGITTVRNPGGPTRDATALRDRVAAGQIAGPTILTAGYILNRARRSGLLTRWSPFDCWFRRTEPMGRARPEPAHRIGTTRGSGVIASRSLDHRYPQWRRVAGKWARGPT